MRLIVSSLYCAVMLLGCEFDFGDDLDQQTAASPCGEEVAIAFTLPVGPVSDDVTVYGSLEIPSRVTPLKVAVTVEATQQVFAEATSPLFETWTSTVPIALLRDVADRQADPYVDVSVSAELNCGEVLGMSVQLEISPASTADANDDVPED